MGGGRIGLMAAALAALIASALLWSPWNGGNRESTPKAGTEALADCIDRVVEDGGPTGAELEGDEVEGGEEAAICGVRKPEPFAELKAATDALGQRVGVDSPADALASARLQRNQAKRARSGHVPGTRGRWTPLGEGPLQADDPNFPATYGEGFGELAGRISDYAYDSDHDRLYAAVASGGIWESANGGRSWRSIGESLPTQTTGSVEYSPAAGGTLIVVTGDNAFGGNTYGGLGVFRSTDDGRSWKRAEGVPNGAQGFKAAVDPTNPKVIYAATGAGLFRSGDDGKKFTNVKLPTGTCRGNTFRKANCFFANVVTDVVVQAPDHFGNKGGAVLAAVGWRDGPRPNLNGRPEAPGNGLYVSDDGRPGSFRGIDEDAAGFTPQAKVGRVELGEAVGPEQDHGYVYAIVQDAELFNSGTVGGLDVPDGGTGATATPTYLNGIYVSDDFGRSWTLMAGDTQLLLPTSGSTLAQLSPLGFGPGIQAWYNEWIQPDPTREQGGVPTRLVFGLEEIYENRLPTPQNGESDFKVIGPYNATGGPCLLVLASDACSDASAANPNRFTTHPDQHAGIFVPDGDGNGVTLFAGNDGGNYTQSTRGGVEDFSQQGFGRGADDGFHTLLPYGVAGARDGVVYAGLQDNGEMKIQPNGRQVEVYGGDGVFTQVDPKNSDVAYEEVPEAGISVTTDGGVTWRSIDPFVDNASFYSPLVMDPRDSDHLLTGGRQIVSSRSGPATTSPGDNPLDTSTDWKTVFDLGDSKRGEPNQTSAIGVRRNSVYAGYCGGCDPVLDRTRFFSGLATNVSRRGKGGTERRNRWHKVRAKGLPQRFISDVSIDPRHRRTVYVTLGASSLRPYAPPRSLGESGESTRGGHVYKSTNAGRSFHDISANLKRTPALWSVVRGRQLIVATTVGVFASRGTNGGRYELLGRNLPAAPVFSLAPVPGKKKQLLAASLGRGVYRYRFR
jgi:hypothetical protein